MSGFTLLPLSDGIRVDSIASSRDTIQIHIATDAPYAPCPLCKRPSERVHSRYERTLADLPWGHVAVRIRVRARRFFCDNPGCQRCIFAEPLTGLADRYAHKTQRLRAALYLIGYALGGEAGAREAVGLGFTVSADTLLRRVRQVAASVQTEANKTVRVVGVDDWAFRKRHRYGTILVDLERRRLLDLLPDRSAENLTRWLQEHPDIEIVSRDRAGCYAEGAGRGAPQAVQVADRWHVLHNLSEAMEKLLVRHHRDLRQVAERLSALPHPPPSQETTAVTVPQPPIASLRSATSERQESEHRRQRRLDRYEEVRRRHQQGQSQRAIARAMGLARDTVRQYLHVDEFPERAQPRALAKPLVPYLPYLAQRWEQGCHNIRQLHREIVAQGYQGGYLTVYRHLTGPLSPVPDRTCEIKPVAIAPPSPRTTTWLLLKEAGQQPQEDAFVQALVSQSPVIQQAQGLALEFFEIVRHRKAEALGDWMERVNAGNVPELQSFVRGLKRDAEAVLAGLTEPWSNGQTEGQVNRLKLIKRQMYGRAKFDLLRARLMPMAEAV